MGVADTLGQGFDDWKGWRQIIFKREEERGYQIKYCALEGGFGTPQERKFVFKCFT